MKIALTCPASLPATQFGGIMFLCVHVAKKLSNDGHDLTIYTTDLDFANTTTFNKKLPKQEKIENFVIKRTHTWLSFFLFFINPGMYKQMMNDNYDIIHAVGIRSFQAFIAAIVSKRKKIPLVISDQGGLTTHPDLKEASFIKKFLIKLQTPLIKFIINQASNVIVANDYEKNIFLNFCNESKISIVKNGIDLNELKKPTEVNFCQKYGIKDEFILFLGRFHKVKGVDTLLEAINLIKNNPLLKGLKIVIMGVNFGFESEMLQLIEKLGITENVVVIKNPPRVDVLSAYNESKFLVLPSRWELSPLTPLEGFAFKKTVISTTAHGIPYTLTNNENCLLVPPGKPHELAKCILDLLQNPKKSMDLGLSGYKLIEETCNSDRMSLNYLKVYQQLLKK